MIELGLSSWSVHGLLGKVRHTIVDGEVVVASGDPAGALTLLELPALLRKKGISRFEICHFHLPRVDDAYLSDLRAELEKHRIQLDNILIDTGNLSQPDDEGWRADIAEAKFWQDIAAKLGGKGVRADCGKEPAGPESLARAATSMQILADHGASNGTRVTTENFHPTSREADNLLRIMQASQRDIGLCVDFGNAEATTDKFATLAKLMPHGTSIHGKANYLPNGDIDGEDFDRCLDLMKTAAFSGPFVLIINETENELAKIDQLRDYVSQRVAVR